MDAIQYLDPEIANEGANANAGFFGLDPRVGGAAAPGSEWDMPEVYQPFVDPPRIPDYNFVKTSVQGGKPHPLRKYFPQFTGIPYRFQPLPVWVYRAGYEPRVLSTIKQAEAHGLQLAPNKLSLIASGEWSLEPINIKPFNPELPGAGKTLQTKPRAEADQAALIAAAVGAAMAQMGVKPVNALAGPASSDPDFAEFQAFKAWKASQAKPVAPVTLSPDEERAALVKIAGEAKIKVKDDWSLDRIRAELEKQGGK